MTSNFRANAEVKITSPPNLSVTDGAEFAPQVRATLRKAQSFSEHHVTSLLRVEPAQFETETIPGPRSGAMRLFYEPAKRGFDLLLGSVLLIIAIHLILIAAV